MTINHHLSSVRCQPGVVPMMVPLKPEAGSTAKKNHHHQQFHRDLIAHLNSGLASRGSETSVSSMASIDSEDSSSSATTSTRKANRHHSRRSIFSEYWEKTAVMPSGIHALEREPRSPLLEHYPSRSNNPASSAAVPSPTSILKTHKNTVSPSSRRSIFGAASPDLQGSTKDHNSNIYLDRYFSRHEHMKVLSSSSSSFPSLDKYDSALSPATTLLLRRQRNPRSYSCSDDTLKVAAEAARSSCSSHNAKRMTPLPSCLRRRRSTNASHNGQSHHSPLRFSSSELSTAAPSCEELSSEPSQSPLRKRTSSVTFDSQIEVLAFEPIPSYDTASTCTDGSWTDRFER